MEPLSIWGFALLSMAAGAIYVTLTKKENAARDVAKNEAEEKTSVVIDTDKEKAIDELIASNDKATESER